MAVTDVLRPISTRKDGAATADTVVVDLFDRFEVNGWGEATTGQQWTTTGGVASDYSVEGG